MSILDRRTLIARSAAAAALATLGSRLPAVATPTAEPSPEDLAAANTTFALDLYRELRELTDGNMLVSPYSISMALAMTWAGASGDTKTQMEEVLGFAVPGVNIHASFAALTDDLTERGNVEADEERGQAANGLRIANALWGEQTYPFDPDFIDALDADYGAGLELVDFKGDPEGARNDINDWVEEQTEDRIQDIVPQGAITPLSRLVLANAIWFYGSWLHDFDPMATNDEPFHLIDADPVDVPFMYQEEEFAYAALDGMQLVSLPYASAGFTMTIILPDEGRFDDVETSLDAVTLATAIDEMARAEVYLWLPKFEFEYAASLADTLKAMGMTDAFDAGLADFSGMIGEGADPEDGLSISDVLHKAFIAVDEEGTEAAAATVVIMEAGAAPPDDKPLPIELRVDRPFLFAIRDTTTGTILFLGRVTDPRG